jgi:hypothetical protein
MNAGNRIFRPKSVRIVREYAKISSVYYRLSISMLQWWIVSRVVLRDNVLRNVLRSNDVLYKGNAKILRRSVGSKLVSGTPVLTVYPATTLLFDDAVRP